MCVFYWLYFVLIGAFPADPNERWYMSCYVNVTRAADRRYAQEKRTYVILPAESTYLFIFQ